LAPRSSSGRPGGRLPEQLDVYERLAGELREAIMSGRYQPGDRLPSTTELMASHGVANLTVRGAYRMLVEEGLVEAVPKKGFFVRQPDQMTWHLTAAADRRGPLVLDGWAADAAAAGRSCREEVSVAIEDGAALVAGRPIGQRLGLPPGARVLVRRRARFTGPAGDPDAPATTPDSLADAYYPYDLTHDTPLASPAPADTVAVLAGLGHPPRELADELMPRLASLRERQRLRLAPVSVVLELARTACTKGHQPVLVDHQIRRGDGAIYTYRIPAPGR
jgi:GntR family transcriptional regulator